MSKLLLYLVLFGFSANVCAQNPSTSIPGMEYDVFTKESLVKIKGKEFRKIEFKSKNYYLQIYHGGNQAEELQFFCGPLEKPFETSGQETSTVQVTKRGTGFIDGLQAACHDLEANKTPQISEAMRSGFMPTDSYGEDGKKHSFTILNRSNSNTGVRTGGAEMIYH